VRLSGLLMAWFDDRVSEVVDALSKHVPEVPGLDTRKEFRNNILTDCSLALQLGNALIARMGFALDRDQHSFFH
jgi:hypothetical protein